MKLIVLTRPTFFVEEDKILTTLFEEGLTNLHLYKPHSEPVYSERLLTLLPEGVRKRITVHEHYYLKDEFGLHGIHLPQADIPTPQGYRGNVSRTCHAIGELSEAKRQSDYVILKTLFDSQSNPTDKQTIDYDQLTTAAHQGLIDRKVYAMGGMNLDHIQLVRDLGFGGVVVCGDLWNRFNIHQETDYKALIAHFKKLYKAMN